jgi:hypothetical protein
MLSSFLGTVAKRADEILGMGATVPAHMKAAAATSVDGIAIAVDAQSAGISAHIAELRRRPATRRGPLVPSSTAGTLPPRRL